jgi:hypothetical protein
MAEIVPVEVLQAGSLTSRIPDAVNEVVGVERTLSVLARENVRAFHPARQGPEDFHHTVIHRDVASLSVLAPEDGKDSALKVDM